MREDQGIENVAILVDGGFYRKQAKELFGAKSPADRAEELVKYCNRHLLEHGLYNRMYRIFYYDCRPSEKRFKHPLTDEEVNLAKTPGHHWMTDFLEALASKRKVALRFGEILESEIGYVLRADVQKRLCRGELDFAEVTEDDFRLDIKQKGVDTRICLDIASLSYQRLVTQIVLIAGDSDFVPAAKYARRAGIDFILDPLRLNIKKNLNEHVDGIRCKTGPMGLNSKDTLHVDSMLERN
ncbi:MAG: NYN domain-containing protein [Actinomycetia bacterium]|nr:NYN domain-containing protein [Actinomycetes bacterium]